MQTSACSPSAPLVNPPGNVPELRQFMGMVNQIGTSRQRSPNPSVRYCPRDAHGHGVLHRSRPSSRWRTNSQRLSHWLTMMSLLMQKFLLLLPQLAWEQCSFRCMRQTGNLWHLLLYTTTDTERRYALMEKKALACTWVILLWEVLWLHLWKLTTETDHKPLVPLLGTKQLDGLRPLPLSCIDSTSTVIQEKKTARSYIALVWLLGTAQGDQVCIPT